MKIIAELKAGIDPTTSELIGDIYEYWMHDENSDVILTGYHGVIADNVWAVDGNNDYYITSTGTSDLWQIDGSNDTILI